ncbi:MAG: tripartite tricarboxylate transporter substrate binding protein [Burkholderiales bacterium]|nr:tripartite tricarboxylate transporter substrate binding protein [Burkholderiales bacterium]
MQRRTFVLAALAGTSLAAGRVAAQSWPAKPVRVVIPFPPGGPTDNLARPLLARLSERLGQQFLIDNRAGANGNIGAEYAARSAPDGYTFFWSPTGTMAVNPAIYPKLGFDPVKDFAPVSLIAGVEGILIVAAAAPYKTVRELVADAKANPGRLTFASPGTGSVVHLLGEQLKHLGGIDIVHVPYKGVAPAMTDLIGGQVTMMFDSTASALNQARAGKVRMLATGARRRLSQAPDLPTMEEAGVSGYDSSSFHAVYAPAATPRAIVDRLSTEIAAALKTPEIRERYNALGSEPVGSTPEALAAALKEATERWGGLARRINLKVDG